MNTLPFARKYIRFEKSSLISGTWNDARYPHVIKPLEANDDIGIHTLVWLKAAGCMGTVCLQVSIAKHIRCDVGDGYFVAQTDDDAKVWSVARGQGFILSIPDIARLGKQSVTERSRYTQDKWSFRHLDLYISGPGKTSRQSKQVRRVWTDESHLTDNYEDGALKEFDDRRERWGWAGKSIHATTAADSGAEVDRLYYLGRQWEYHWRCPECQQLIWPLWREVTPSQVHAGGYYGKDVFLWDEFKKGGDETCATNAIARAAATPHTKGMKSTMDAPFMDGRQDTRVASNAAQTSEPDAPLTEDEILDTIRVRCPHCDSIFKDTQQDRASLIGSDYVAMNTNPRKGVDSYRWNVFAIADLPWRKTLATYREAMRAAQLGNLALLENFAKKQLCASWTPTIPDFGQVRKSNYNVGDVWIVEENKLRVCSFDFQEGHGATGVHWWGLCDEFLKTGDSRRLEYRRLESWADCRAFQQHFQVKDGDTFCDAGFRDKEVFARCAEWLWYALVSSDETEFTHNLTVEGRKTLVPNSYFTQTKPQDSMSGKAAIIAKKKGIIVPRGRSLPSGWCYSRTWSKPNIGFLLLRLMDGRLGFDYGIPRDIGEAFTSQLNSYIERIDVRKKDGTRQRVLAQIKESDHAFACASQNLLGTVIRGFFPLAKMKETT